LSEDGDMPRARPQFVHLSEAEVWKAIASKGADDDEVFLARADDRINGGCFGAAT